MVRVIQVETVVPESRQVTVILPPDVPTGPVRVTVTVGSAPDTPVPGWPYYRPADPTVSAEYDAFWHLFPALLANDKGRYIAIYQGQVTDTGNDLDEVSRRFQARHGASPVYITQVCDGSELVRIGGIRMTAEKSS